MTIQNLAKTGLVLLTLSYPFLVYFGLQHFDLWWIAIILIAIGLIRFLSKSDKIGPSWLWPVLALGLSGTALYLQDATALKLYPVFVNLSLLLVFAHSLRFPPTVIERIARLSEPDLPEDAIRYTRQVTLVWCLFFIINATVSLFITLYGDEELWFLYNGIIAYILMGAIFVIEWLVRQWARKKSERQNG